MMKNLAQVDKMVMNLKIKTICQIPYHPREPIDLVRYHSNFQKIIFQFTLKMKFISEPGALSFVTAFMSGILVSLTLRLYKLSRNYRYATRILSREKKELKQEKGFGQGNRIGNRVWAPLPSVLRTQG